MIKKLKYRTDFIFPTHSFLTGAGSVLNIGGNYFDFKCFTVDKESDSKAILSDWGTIGDDLIVAAENLEKELNLAIS